MKTTTKNALVNLNTNENYGESDVHGNWEVTLEKGKAEVSYIGGVDGEVILPSGNCGDLEEFEEELSERFETQVAFSGLTEEERKEQDQWVKLQSLVQSGKIVHAIRINEEFLTDGETYVFLGRSKTEDWADFENIDGDGAGDFFNPAYNPKNWTPKEGVTMNPEGNYPDGHGDFQTELTFEQKNTEVNNPVNEYPGWEDDFMVIENNGNYFISKK